MMCEKILMEVCYNELTTDYSISAKPSHQLSWSHYYVENHKGATVSHQLKLGVIAKQSVSQLVVMSGKDIHDELKMLRCS
ncbi:MAG: hypothetical protein COS89_05825 [Deltaproteobacteria bacterium CG07_land_8_20_14_0_80_38_7]|nr:MAG: hypothetical protein COS89_05825 [Deltaproteobacteria bacterium CG07_land_8_20_14_0_80_38_7]